MKSFFAILFEEQAFDLLNLKPLQNNVRPET